MIMNKRIIILLVSIVFIVACANKNTEAHLSEYRTDAQSYCNVHTPEYWKSSGKLDELNKMNPTEKADALATEIGASVKNPKMQDIIISGRQVSIKEFYPYLQKRIPELTQEPFECPAIENFYSGK